jgi:hypothetical protein
MQIVTYSLRLARRQKQRWPKMTGRYRRLTHRRHRRAVRVWLKTGQRVRNMDRPLTRRYLD